MIWFIFYINIKLTKFYFILVVGVIEVLIIKSLVIIFLLLKYKNANTFLHLFWIKYFSKEWIYLKNCI